MTTIEKMIYLIIGIFEVMVLCILTTAGELNILGHVLRVMIFAATIYTTMKWANLSIEEEEDFEKEA